MTVRSLWSVLPVMKIIIEWLQLRMWNYFKEVDYDVDTHTLNLFCCIEHYKDATGDGVRHNSYSDLCEQKFVACDIVQQIITLLFVKMYEMKWTRYADHKNENQYVVTRMLFLLSSFRWYAKQELTCFFFNLHSGGWNQGPLDTAAT
jgi:hypothetical protein